mgnify:FL=1
MVEAVILGGGNIGDVEHRLAEAERLIGERVGKVVARSSLHRSEAWGFRSQNDFLNRAFVVRTALAPEELLDATQGIERELGRDREQEYREKLLSGEPYASRRIDLDILLYGDEHISTPRLQVPHPLIMHREFALAPLCEATGLTREKVGEKIKTIVKR